MKKIFKTFVWILFVIRDERMKLKYQLFQSDMVSAVADLFANRTTFSTENINGFAPAEIVIVDFLLRGHHRDGERELYYAAAWRAIEIVVK